MDYEKLYHEALERAKGMCALQTDKATMEYIFPELCESEDERIRKELLDCLRNQIIKPHEKKLRFMAWLKGLNFADLNLMKEFNKGMQEALIWGREGYEVSPDGKVKSLTQNEIDSVLKKQKEQKPILEVFGFKVGDAVRLKDGDGRKHIVKSFEEVEGLHGPNFYHVEFEDNSARDSIYPGEEYPNGYYTQMEKFEEEQKLWKVGANAYFTPEQKPVEWNANNKAFIKYCARILDENGHVASAERLLSMFPVKPVEWSEEDEKKLEDLVSLLAILEGCSTVNVGTAAKYCGWLNSFRSRPKSSDNWKPSEEQMGALRSIINDPNNAGAEGCQLAIRELYKQLKRIKED